MTNSEIIALLMPVFGALTVAGTVFLMKWVFIGPKPKPKQKQKPKVDLSTARESINAAIGDAMRAAEVPTATEFVSGRQATMTAQIQGGPGEWLIHGRPASRDPKPASHKS